MGRNWKKTLADAVIVTLCSAGGILLTRFIGVKNDTMLEDTIEAEPVSVEDAPAEVVATEGE